tara:strand:+ start:348 stop:728 length:381 start_codon:yes stop_codon:yes gene_type:complete
MYQGKPRRFRRRTNGRNNMPHNNSQHRMRTNQFSNGQSRNNFRPSLSAEKSFEKYTTLAKEAMSAGDKTLSENYLQHADHFMRIIEVKNKNRNDIGNNIVEKSSDESKNLSEDKKLNQNEQTKNET